MHVVIKSQYKFGSIIQFQIHIKTINKLIHLFIIIEMMLEKFIFELKNVMLLWRDRKKNEHKWWVDWTWTTYLNFNSIEIYQWETIMSSFRCDKFIQSTHKHSVSNERNNTFIVWQIYTYFLYYLLAIFSKYEFETLKTNDRDSIY